MKRILVAVDGSEPSLRAAKLAAELSSKVGSKLTLAYVSVPIVVPTEVYYVPNADLENAEQKRADEVLRDSANLVRGTAPEVSAVHLRGGAAEMVADAALADDVDMVVVGSRGRNAVARVLLGSVADRLVHICKKPVLVVR